MPISGIHDLVRKVVTCLLRFSEMAEAVKVHFSVDFSPIVFLFEFYNKSKEKVVIPITAFMPLHFLDYLTQSLAH